MTCSGCYSSSATPQQQAGLSGLGQPLPTSVQTPHFKIVLLGDSGVGKSSLLLREARGQFLSDQHATVGAAFVAVSVHLEDGTTVKLEAWDTAGQERYASLAPLYYRGAAAAVLVFDLTRPSSLARAKHWAAELQANASSARVVLLVGNKRDLEEERMVPQGEAEAYAASQGMQLLLTSAKTGEGVHDLFKTLARELVAASRMRASAAGPSAARAAAPVQGAAAAGAASAAPGAS